MREELPENHFEGLEIQLRESVDGGTVVHLIQDGDIVTFRPSEWGWIRKFVDEEIKQWKVTLPA